MYISLFRCFFTHINHISVFSGPDEGRRGQNKGGLRPAAGGHAERLPYPGGIDLHFLSLSISRLPPVQDHIPCILYVLPWVIVRVCKKIMWREKRKMYCIHFFAALSILCMVTNRVCACVRQMDVIGPFVPSSVYMIRVCSRVALPKEDCSVDVL